MIICTAILMENSLLIFSMGLVFEFNYLRLMSLMV